MFGTYSYDRRKDATTAIEGHRHHATDKRRHHYQNQHQKHLSSSFSIMRWFRRTGKRDDDNSTWFRNDLQRLRQLYAGQESDYAAVTPIVAHRRRQAAAATWSKWSGSTTTVYSFAYVDGTRRDNDDGVSLVDDDVVEYIDAATLPVVIKRLSDRGQCSSSSRTGTMTTTRRRNKRVAPPLPSLPPPPPTTTTTTATTGGTVIGSSSSAEMSKTVTQRRTATIVRKKYKAPQPPAITVTAVESRPQQHNVAVGRRVPSQRRRNKGPAPKPPVERHQRADNPATAVATVTGTAAVKPSIGEDDDGRRISNVRRKITEYERDRLMQRVDKIEKHFFEKHTGTVVEKRASETAEPKTTTNSRHGFASASALYTAMAVTNLTELDKRAAEICRRKLLETAATAATSIVTTVSRQQQQTVVTTTANHKNAVVAAVIQKTYPSAAVVSVDGHKRPAVVWPPPTANKSLFSGVLGKSSTYRRKPTVAETVIDEKQLVRHKRLAFFQQRAMVDDDKRQTANENGKITTSRSTVAAAKLSSGGTQTTRTVMVAKTSPTIITTNSSTAPVTAAATAIAVVEGGGRGGGEGGKGGECSSESKHLLPEENNCYEQLLAMEMQSDLVLHNGSFECAVCLCTYDNNGVVLRDCLHVFCRLCLQMTIGHSNAERIECPYIDERYSCPGVLQHREIKKILDSDEEYERFLERSVERARQLLAKDRNGGSFQCARPDCTGWCLLYDKHNVFEFKCPVCQAVTCVRCGSIHAPGKVCRIANVTDSGTLDTLENLIERGDAMPCPGCKTILSKQQGCDWIKCAVCFMEICWATKGPRWGPKGKGDTTAGCMCGIPVGRKCHVDCKYCH